MTEIDRRNARCVNDTFAGSLIPVSADVATPDVIFVEQAVAPVNAPGLKGLCELSNLGTPVAVANAVFHATGKRERALPIGIKSLL